MWIKQNRPRKLKKAIQSPSPNTRMHTENQCTFMHTSPEKHASGYTSAHLHAMWKTVLQYQKQKRVQYPLPSWGPHTNLSSSLFGDDLFRQGFEGHPDGARGRPQPPPWAIKSNQPSYFTTSDEDKTERVGGGEGRNIITFPATLIPSCGCGHHLQLTIRVGMSPSCTTLRDTIHRK